MSKYIKLFNKALGLSNPVERSRYELETNQSTEAEDGGETTLRQLDSTSTEPPQEEEASTTESETKSLDIHEQYHNDPSKHQGCCGFIECRTASNATHDKDIYILTGRKGR